MLTTSSYVWGLTRDVVSEHGLGTCPQQWGGDRTASIDAHACQAAENYLACGDCALQECYADSTSLRDLGRAFYLSWPVSAQDTMMSELPDSDQEPSDHPTSPDWSPSPEIPSEIEEAPRSGTPQREQGGLQEALLRQEEEQAALTMLAEEDRQADAERREMRQPWRGQWSSWSWWEGWPWQSWQQRWSSAAAAAPRGQEAGHRGGEGRNWRGEQRGERAGWCQDQWQALRGRRYSRPDSSREVKAMTPTAQMAGQTSGVLRLGTFGEVNRHSAAHLNGSPPLICWCDATCCADQGRETHSICKILWAFEFGLRVLDLFLRCIQAPSYGSGVGCIVKVFELLSLAKMILGEGLLELPLPCGFSASSHPQPWTRPSLSRVFLPLPLLQCQPHWPQLERT